MNQQDEIYMRRAIELARQGGRAVAPNPMVGAVIVKDGKILAEGYHRKFGGPHAEVMAMAKVHPRSKMEGATMYVTLEPCKHFGKTPPCADAVAISGIQRVVVGAHDPFQENYELKITNYELEFLKGPVADECRDLNRFFFTWVEKKRPFITVKIAVSADGFVAKKDGTPVRLTSPEQDREVHQLRALHQAIMVGANTVMNDDPHLGVRHAEGVDPLRVIVDSTLSIPEGAQVLRDSNVLIATTHLADRHMLHVLRERGVDVWASETDSRVNLVALMQELADRKITSVLVEPGPTLYQSLKKAHLIDQEIIYRSEQRLGEGLPLDI
ncbi:bifunctional diaminohydroxyphosphoribosylaminopyrimidine deaminase/5-amino-6-(5-phosphoribosylamino)uracil reductase RibD [Candidatus Peregrinibacteria bacterium]|nr:MAG: bifunctional diaminohydroxyphosphoribosylaminopyrimidine deaminase/5-amino-6-(5-phosphoribosylamino)uracil reductase RibD [Candidatus Peregrinibacteria bacterium]